MISLFASCGMIAASVAFGLAWHHLKALQLSRRAWPAPRLGLITVSSAWVVLWALPLAALGGNGEEDPSPSPSARLRNVVVGSNAHATLAPDAVGSAPKKP